jgi:4'-phosphopantetheinyl transferase EntD
MAVRGMAADRGPGLEMQSVENQVREGELSQRLIALLPEPARGAVRMIRSSDAGFLTPAEMAQCSGAIDKVRQQRGAARHLARSLMVELGAPASDVLRAPSGAPQWPAEVVGSISHDDTTAAVVMALACHGLSLGVDVEPDEPLPCELVPLIASPSELADAGEALADLRLLFAIKEAVFKAVFPQDGQFLDFQDVSVDVEAGTAETCYGREVRWRSCRHSHIFVVAWV